MSKIFPPLNNTGLEDFILPAFNGGKFYTACFFTGGKFYTACFLMVENFILSKSFCPKFSCIKFSMPDIPKFSNTQKLVCIKFYVKNFPVSCYFGGFDGYKASTYI